MYSFQTILSQNIKKISIKKKKSVLKSVFFMQASWLYVSLYT